MNQQSSDSQHPDRPSYYVGIGASAGGLEAIESFFSTMPPDSGMAFVVIQHLSPDYKSLMVELLSKRTQMQVLRAEDGLEVKANRIYLILPKKNLTIFHGRLLLSEQDHSRGINLPIDVFMRSLADDQGEKAIGIILSGTGSDGMRGIRSIKEAGGMVMVQDVDSAKFDGMPRSAISTGLADFVVPAHEMPRQMLSFAKHPYLSKVERSDTLLTDEDGMTRIFAMLRERTKVDFTFYKPSTVVRRIERRMMVNQIEDLRDYVRFLESYAGEVGTLYRELLIGVTSFFRDRDAFDELARNWLPDLIKKKADGDIRFWVAGCSTGEEAYTLAMLASEAIESSDRAVDVKIFATDVDRDAILRAGTGVYPESIAADLPPQMLTKYFIRKRDNFQIVRRIREMVVFAQHNLVKDPPFTKIDLVSCRNLMIYLQPILQNKVLELFNFSLNAAGILMLGTSETTGDMADYFETLHHKAKIYRCKGLQRIMHSTHALTVDRRVHRESWRQGMGSMAFRGQHEERMLERFLLGLVGDWFHLAMLINEDHEVLHSVGETNGLFSLPPGRMKNDVTRMATGDLAIPLATGLQKAFSNNEPVTFSALRLPIDGMNRYGRMRIKPLPSSGKGQVPMVVLVIDFVQEETAGDAPDVHVYDAGQEAEQRIRDLEQELQFTRENLQATIEELETSNEELQATNEELLSSNEELQSTNEELQSVNEELHTVNSEYQSKIIELTELNNDMDNLLKSTQIATLFLDENLEIRRITPQAEELLHLSDRDLGRPLSHVLLPFKNIDFHALAREVGNTNRSLESELESETGQAYLLRVLPYMVSSTTASGVVLAFIDISQRRKAQQALRESEALLRKTSRLAKVGSWSFCVESQTHTWDEETFRIHDLDSGRQPSPEEGIHYYAEAYRPVITQAFQRAVKHGEPYDLVLQIISAKGRRKWVRAIGRPEKEGDRVIRVTGSFQDITDLRAAEESLNQSKIRYETLFRKMLNGFALHEIVCDDHDRPVDYIFLDVNPAFESLTGIPREEVIGKRVTDVLPGLVNSEFDWIGIFGKVALGGEPVQFISRSEPLSKSFRVSAFSPAPRQFVTLFDEAGSSD